MSWWLIVEFDDTRKAIPFSVAVVDMPFVRKVRGQTSSWSDAVAWVERGQLP